MGTLTLAEVMTVRDRVGRARELTAERFREAFAAAPAHIPPNERWRAHLEIQAQSLLEMLPSVSLPDGHHIRYVLSEAGDRLIAPIVVQKEQPLPAASEIRLETALFPFFRIERSGVGLLEYWMLVSELLSSASSSVTRLIASSSEYDAAVSRIDRPDMLRALYVSYLPSFEWRSDETAMLELTLYSKAGEERIERRRIHLDRNQELVLHDREVIVEGRGGIAVG
ncbi:MAG TPA: hypothetical protein VNM92_08355 [Thermoanaerobaculia bacterium]|nr:hypothetical protein [Thermoanaerobaculia bacterium]